MHLTPRKSPPYSYPLIGIFVFCCLAASATNAGEHVALKDTGDDLLNQPGLAIGQTTTGTLAAGESAIFLFTTVEPVWHGAYVSSTGLALHVDAVDLSVPGTYELTLSNTNAAAQAYSLRVYNHTNTIAHVSALLTNLMETYNVVGIGFSLVDGDHVVWQTGFGHADLERGIPADENTVFMIGSVSKTFGAVAAMQLAEEGLLELDASITNALPDFAIHQRFADNIITPRTILTHHSGLPGDVFNQGFSMRPIPDVPDALQAIVAEDFTLMPTNTFWAYNNSGFVLLNQMFRHITGQTLDVFARERLFDRMGMAHSSIAYDLPYIREHLARPYMDGVLYPDEYVNLFFAGAIYSTPADMARYLRMLLNGGMGDNARVISQETLQAMATKQNADVPLDQFNSLLNMGIGFMLDPPALQYMGKTLWHNGETVYFRSILRAALDAQLGAFFTSNSDEGGLIENIVVDSALKWAYEEKTGIAPPDPVDPGTPAAATPPAGLIELATNGVFVTGLGYSRFGWDGEHLMVNLHAQMEGSSALPLHYRENGWFTPTNAFSPQFTIAEADGYIVSIYKDFADGVTNMVLFGERSPNVAGFDSAWSNRLGRWWATDMHPDDISWFGEEVRLTVGLLELYEQENMLLLQTEMLYVMNATNDTLAIAAGLGRNKGSVLRAIDSDTLRFMGVTYRSEDGIPLLAPGTATNGVTVADEIHWFRIPATATPLTIDLDTAHDLTAYVYTEEADYLGQANRAHAFHLDEEEAQPLVVAVVRNGENPDAWRLAVHTDTIPFYVQLDPSDWPSQLVESAHRYPNADFGHVFVRENRSEPEANVLKIAIVRMMSTNATARPLLFLNGGPGDSGIRCAYQYFLQGFQDTHHVYLIDPRGVNLSQPALAFVDDEELDEFQYRLRMLQQADFSAIHTAELAGDVNDVVAAFGLAEADLIGQSYGTFLAQAVMRHDPPWLRAVVLDGVVAPNIPGLSQTGPARHAALDAFFADLATNPLYPMFADTFYALAERLQDHPAAVPIYGEPNLLDGINFLDAVLNQLTSTDLGARERIPGIVWRAAHNEDAALAELFEFRKDTNVVFNSIHDPLQQILVIKHDMLPFDSLAAATNACVGLHPLLAELSIGFMESAVDAAALFDDYGQADPSIATPVVSIIPTLVINGTYDTQTAVDWAAEVASHLPNARFVVPPAVGHGVLFATNGCTLQIMRDFLANPATPPDTACLDGLVLGFPSPWPTDATSLAPGDSLSGSVTNPGVADWYELAIPPVAPVGGIADIHGQLRIVAMPDPFLVRIYGADDGAPIAQHRGPGTLDFVADGTPFVLAIQPATFGEQTGDYEIEFSVPLLVRKLDMNPPNVELIWQGPTGAVVSVEAAPYLAGHDTFAPLVEGIAFTNTLQREVFPAGPDAGRVFRVTEPTSPTNGVGQLLHISDFHLSPFVDAAILPDLVAQPIAQWDALFAVATNGLFTHDASGWKTTSPLLLESALLNARAAAPNPDAVFFTGDLIDYEIIQTYTNLVPGGTPGEGRTLVLKTAQYVHGKLVEAFPNAPIFVALGNNDTYLGDYDIEEAGDAFYADTAAAFHAGALTNLIAYDAFTATYTNAGHYAVPFGNGNVVVVQTAYLSARYPRGTASGWAQLEHLELALQAATAANSPAWIVLHIPPGINPYDTWRQQQAGDPDAAATDWDEDFLESFCQIVAAHTDVVAGIFAGHYHNRSWQLIADPATTNAVAAMQIANGILYNHGNNPGFTVFAYDRTSLAILAENTYSLDVAVHTGGHDPDVPWSIRYSQNQGYGIPDLSVASLEGAWNGMAVFEFSSAGHYNAEYSGGRMPLAMNPTNWPVYYNAIRFTTPTQFRGK
jgi:CubicO group peptidase (beta-lactamase class C family)/pimeloyl-ACP methyl ester carboxylesterase